MQENKDKYSNTNTVYFKVSLDPEYIIDEVNELEANSNIFTYIKRSYSGNSYRASTGIWHALHKFEFICPNSLTSTSINIGNLKILNFEDQKRKTTFNPVQIYTIQENIGSTTKTNYITTEYIDEFTKNHFDKYLIKQNEGRTETDIVALQSASFGSYFGEHSFFNVFNLFNQFNFNTLKEFQLQREVSILKNKLKNIDHHINEIKTKLIS